MYNALWDESHEYQEHPRAQAIFGAVHRFLAIEGGEPEIVIAAAILATVPKEKRQELLEKHVANDLHAEIQGILDGDPQNTNAAIVHDSILLAEYHKDLWKGDIDGLRASLEFFKTKSGKRDARQQFAEREHDAGGTLRPGAQKLRPVHLKTPTSSQKEMKKLATEGRDAQNEPLHWADQWAASIVKERGNQTLYTVAAGITPSGVVHFGNFREIITNDLVVKALERLGKKVRFIYSWDDYDTFRKIPKNVPNQEKLKTYLFQPAVDVPDPFDCGHESYADHFKAEIMEDLPLVGIFPEFLHQSKKYRACEYADDIRHAMLHREEIRTILNEFKTEEMDDSWWPLIVYCQKCNRDRTVKVNAFDGDYGVTYSCECGYSNTFDLRKNGIAKLPWRVDWPMRWNKEKVDFEPAGKEHSSAGGSFDTGKEIVEKIWNYPMVHHFMYEFISIKGQGGKMSSSLGNTVTLRDALKVYTPQLVRFLFAGTRPSAAFDVSFDIDIFQRYEEFDRIERIAFGAEEVSEKEKQNATRIYELSVLAPPQSLPVQPSFRHLTNYVQIAEGNMDKVVSMLKDEIKSPTDEVRIRNRALCAWNWATLYAPDQYRFSIQETPNVQSLSDEQKAALRTLGNLLANQDEVTLAELFYQICAKHGIQNTEFFNAAYRAIIGKERGPKLANIITQAGHERIKKILSQV